ncbi:MAG: imelysin family protein [Bacteroidota bacterium]
MNKYFYFVALAMVIGFASCNNDDDSNNLDNLKESVVADYATLVFNNYTAAFNDAQTLRTALNAFTSNPSETTLQAAKDAWLASRESYGITEAFRFANGPIDIIGTEEGPEGLLNAWPLDENFIDYVDGSTNAGIINDPTTYPTIDKDLLIMLNGEGGEENVSVGYHAIEFLLWGQDLTDPSDKQAGMRPHTDFVDGGTASNQDRRRAYLNVCADLLIDHLQLLLDQWQEGGAYRTEFLAFNKDEALSGMMTGIATLSKSELAGERTFTAYDNRDQEDEHSCFSDNTHRDLRLNFAGIKNVYLALINGTENNSIHDLVSDQDAALATEVRAALDAAEVSVNATAIPFDFAISDDSTRPNVLAAVTALRALGDKIAEAGTALGIQVDTE